jgi:para-nitrobenzyl esterase
MRLSPRTSLLLFFVFFFSAPLSFAQNGLTITTDSGPIRGKESSDGKLRIFLGIPYAAPPVGPLRWKPPQPAAPWKDVKDVTAFGSRCWQVDLFKDMVFRDPGMNEDCLTLNIWAPAANDSAKLPVMVWIYGGGFQAGATSEARQDGENLARHGVILVTMNYRLGILGFLATHELAAESPQHAAGNYGLMDQSLALHWVKNNIAAFGGDPAKITVFGESAGAFAVSLHMGSPLSRDIPARAIGESGGALGKSSVVVLDLTASEAEDEKLLKNHVKVEALAALRAVPAAELYAKTTPKPLTSILFMPNIDGYFLTEPLSATFAAGKQAKIPLLAGWNKDELSIATVMNPIKPTVQYLNNLAFQKFKFHAGDFLKVYHASNDAEAVKVITDYNSDEWVVYGTWSWLEAHVSSGVPSVYHYRFDLGVPDGPKHPAAFGAYHSDEIEYVFGTLDSRQGYNWRPEDYKLSELMQLYWTNFAKTGNPNAEGLPNWPAYGPTAWQTMYLDAVSTARPDYQRDRYLFLQKYWK